MLFYSYLMVVDHGMHSSMLGVRDESRYNTVSLFIPISTNEQHRSICYSIVVFVCDEWGTASGGIAAFNMELAKLLATDNESAIHCVVLNADPDAQADAKAHNVTLWHVKHGAAKDVKTNDLQSPSRWCRDGHSLSFVDQHAKATPIDVVGHAHITGDEVLHAVKALRTNFGDVRMLLVNHVLSLDVDPLKSGEESIANANQKQKHLELLARHCNVVLSVGPLMFERYSDEYNGLGGLDDKREF